MSEGVNRGREPTGYCEAALEIISNRSKPVSTAQLAEQLRLNKHETIQLRKMLRCARERGEIRRLVRDTDGSFAWLPAGVPIENCAGWVANLFLEREDEPLTIDPDEFANWARNTGSNSG